MGLFRKYSYPINFFTGSALSLIYMEYFNVGKHILLQTYVANLVLSVFLYSIVHTLIYYRIYLFVSSRQPGEKNTNTCAQSWIYAILLSIGIIGFIKISGST
jgi:DMSO/TMAO reductase YedYZ heme-binding membrane subunit